MKRCAPFEEKLSALIDGEGLVSEVPELMEHLLKCKNCADFFIEVRALDARIVEFEELDKESAMPGKDLWERIASKSGLLQASKWRRLTKYWPVIPSLAATVLIFVIFSGVRNALLPTNSQPANNTVTLEEKPGKMSEKYFIQIVKELIQSDRKYQVEMLKVMREIVQIYPDGTNAEGTLSTETPNDFNSPPPVEVKPQPIGS